MKKLIVALSLALFVSVMVVAVSVNFLGFGDGMNAGGNEIDYFAENSFECEKTENADFVTYAPKGVKARYGLIFYVGTAIAPANYDYLGESLAKQGYLMVVPKASKGFTYLMYTENELAFEAYPDVEFFVGGHSQGGGAAVRRAGENLEKVKGVVLYAPLCYGTDTLVGTGMPTLLLEASNDGVLTADMKADAKTRLPEYRTEYMLDGCHMSFSTMDADATLKMFNDGPATEEVKAAQREDTTEYTLSFMQQVLMRK
ncbi:MAG: hypothetical protein IJ033_02220 [Clostridia bacterium]|nr:hypothetical protein [Clostridia bacterium]